MEAWKEAYFFLDNIFINAEANIYLENKKQCWPGLKEFTLEKRKNENEVNDIASLYLKPVDGKKLPPFKPGQYLTFKI